MKGYLLDTNLLIALLWPAHQAHSRATKWFASHRAKGWVTCPFTEAGFVRIVSNPAFSPHSVRPQDAAKVLAANTAARDHLFWPDEISFEEATRFAASRLVGHQQITDAYLLGLAIRNGGTLATLDEGIASLVDPKSGEAKSLLLLP